MVESTQVKHFDELEHVSHPEGHFSQFDFEVSDGVP
jgi:hypothetical protein